MKDDLLFAYSERICPVCGKAFICHDPDVWVFKRTTYGQRKYLCSWSCTKAFDEEYNNKGTKKARRHNVVEALKKGVPVSKIVERYGVDYGTVRYWKKKLEAQEEPKPEEDDIPIVQGF